MIESPPLVLSETEVKHDQPGSDGSRSAGVAALFQGTLLAYPRAVLKISGNSTIAGLMHDRLRSCGVPQEKVVVVRDWNNRDGKISIVIVYNTHPTKRSVWVEFKLDLDSLPIKVEFEVSPDGAYVEEVKVQFERLKAEIKKQAFGGRVEKIKIGAKVEGLAQFDRPTSDRVETALKAKIKAVLSADVRFPGTKKFVTVELYGASGAKFEDGKVKPIFEGGVMLTVPFDVL